MKPTKPRRCAVRSCRAEFWPRTTLHVVCSPECAIRRTQERDAKAMAKARKAEAANDRKRREALKTRRDWLKEAQEAFNRFIRLRDTGKPCICCGQPMGPGRPGGEVDAGHYRSVGSAPHLRFDERNVHAQRKVCNRFGSGRAVDYRLGLIRRIGLASVEALESDQTPRKWTTDELRAIRDTYRAKAREIERAQRSDQNEPMEAAA